MGNLNGIISSAGSVALGVILMFTLTNWKFALGIVFIICGLFTLLDYIRYCGGSS